MHASHANARKKENSGLTASEAEWHVGYFVTKLDGKALCLKCSDTVATLKDYYMGITILSTHHNILSS